MPPDSAADGDPPLDSDVEDLITERLTEITELRAVIEQAKGMLMLIHGIDADRAFELLKWRSQDTNTKLRPLAEQLVDEFRQLSRDAVLLPSKQRVRTAPHDHSPASRYVDEFGAVKAHSALRGGIASLSRF